MPLSSMKDLVSVKMRASLSGLHVSGAERIVDAGEAGEGTARLLHSYSAPATRDPQIMV